MRSVLVFLHRFVGLAIAAFLIVAGLTGAIISWHHELDELIAPDLHRSEHLGATLPPLELVARVEKADARAQAIYFPVTATQGEAFEVFVQPRVDPQTGAPFALDYNQVFVDPVTGGIIGMRQWGAVRLDRAHLVPLLFALHYSLCLPQFWGVDKWGVWLMGFVAMLWIVDCFVGLALTFPPRLHRAGKEAASWPSRWAIAWRIKWPSAAYRLNVDIHRAFGLWFWAYLLILSVSAVCLDLDHEVARPLVGLFSHLTEAPAETRAPTQERRATPPRLGFAEIIARADAEAREQGVTTPLGAVGYDGERGVYRADFFAPGDEDGPSGFGPRSLYFDGDDGGPLGGRDPMAGTTGDVFLALQLPLHSGRLFGLAGRIFVSIMGLVVAVLSVTGIVVWWKKRFARKRRAAAPPRERAVVPNPSP